MKFQRLAFLCSFTALMGLSAYTAGHAQNTAQSISSTTGATDTQNSVIKKPVVTLYRTLNTIQQPTIKSMDQKISMLRKALEESYDFPAILSTTIGYRYNSFNEQEKTQLLTAFKNYTAARYLSSFGKEKGTGFQILSGIKDAPTGNAKLIDTKIGDADDMGSATEINYLVKETPQGWKIIDVLLNGHISQVAIQHGDFSSTLAKGGSQELIDMLNKKTQSFSAKP